jgi:hypothetical protein
LFHWFEGDATNIVGHIGERGDHGEWETFVFEMIDSDGDQHTISINDDDLGEVDWDRFFDYLEDLALEGDVDYDNEYSDTT